MDSNKTEPIPPGAASCPVCQTCYLDSTHAAACCPGARRCEECTEGPEHSVEDCPHAQPCKTCHGHGYAAIEETNTKEVVLCACDECEAFDKRGGAAFSQEIMAISDVAHPDIERQNYARRALLSLVAQTVLLDLSEETVQPDALRELVSAAREERDLHLHLTKRLEVALDNFAEMEV